MYREIGSNFWLEPFSGGKNSEINLDNIGFKYTDLIFTTSGRCAINCVIDDLGASCKSVMIPAFTCDSVIEPFKENKYNILYYPISSNLQIDEYEFKRMIEHNNPDVIYIHNYFGFNTSAQVKRIIKQQKLKGIIIIEDITQTLFSSFERLESNYQLGSFRKWLGVPDGGYVAKNNGLFKNKPLMSDKKLEETRIKAMKEKYDYIFKGKGNKIDYLNQYAFAEKILENQTATYLMSESSYTILSNLDVETLKKNRRMNYKYLLDSFEYITDCKPIFTNISDDVVPLYFPILCNDNRDYLQSKLRNNNIYAPIVWPKSRYVNTNDSTTERIYKNILCIPCDQRYDENDMQRIIEVLKND